MIAPTLCLGMPPWARCVRSLRRLIPRSGDNPIVSIPAPGYMKMASMERVAGLSKDPAACRRTCFCARIPYDSIDSKQSLSSSRTSFRVPRLRTLID